MPRKTTKKETRIEKVEESRENSFVKLVRSYLLDGEDFPPDLAEYQFKIKVYKYQPDNRAVLVTGRTFDDLQSLPFELGQTFGTSRFRVYITVLDQSGERCAFVKIEDFPILWDSDNAGGSPVDDSDDDEEEQHPNDQFNFEIEKLKMIQAHEIQLKQMETQNQIVIEALKAKSGGAPKITDLLEVLKFGVSLGTGTPILSGSQDDAGSDDYLSGLLNSPLAAALVQKLMSGGSPPASAAPRNDQASLPENADSGTP